MYFVGIDIGSKYVKTVLMNLNEDEYRDQGTSLELLKKSKIKNTGMKSGNFCDLEKIQNAISKSLEIISSDIRKNIKKYFVSISGADIQTNFGKGIVPLWDETKASRGNSKVTKKHVEMVKKSAFDPDIKNGKVLLHSFAQNYQVDDINFIENPLNMSGRELRCVLYSVLVSEAKIENLKTILNNCGISNYEVIYAPLATAEAVLDVERDLSVGAIVIGLGAETTEVIIYKDNTLQQVLVLPIGSEHITKDLLLMLRVNYQTACMLKKERLNLNIKKYDKDNFQKVTTTEGEERSFSSQYIYDIADARVEEIFRLVMKGIHDGTSYRKVKDIQTPIIVAGSAFNMMGIIEFLKDFTNHKAITASIKGIEYYVDDDTSISDYITALGLIKYGVKEFIGQDQEEKEYYDQKQGFFAKVKSFILEIL